MRFWKEKKAVSVVLGTLLMFAMMFALYTSIQVTQVPIWNSQIDVQAYETTYGDMLFLKSDVKNVALLKQPKSTIIRMGARYPDRMIFINPKQGIYGLMTTEDATVTVEYTIEWSTGSANYTANFPSSRLIYESMGAERTKIVYEHGLIIREFPAGYASTDTQELIVGERLYVPLLDTSLFSPMSSMRSESFSLKPFTGSYTRLNVAEVTITLPTDYPRAWADRLEGLYQAKVDEEAGQIIIHSEAIERITFPGDPATDAPISAGVIFCSTETQAGFNPTADFPHIFNISITASDVPGEKQTVSTIRATVLNVTAPFDIHADLTDLVGGEGGVSMYDESPTRVLTTGYSIEDDSWVETLPNEIEVEWDVTHQDVDTGDIFAIAFWVYNSELDQQYSRTVIVIRDSTTAWR